MYHILHRDSEFIGVTPFPWVPLEGVSIIDVDSDVPNLNKVVWDGELLQLVSTVSLLSRVDFILRFTAAEWESASISTDINIKQGIALVLAAEYIDVTDMRTMMLVGYCAMIGIISDTRVAEVLA